MSAIELKGVAESLENFPPNFPPDRKSAENGENYWVSASQVAETSVWSRRKTERFFQKHSAIAKLDTDTNTGGRHRSLLPLSIFPAEIQNAYAAAHPAARVLSLKAPDMDVQMERFSRASDAARAEARRRREILILWESLAASSTGLDLASAKAAFCIQNGLSVSTLYRWERAFAADRMAGLLPASGRKKGATKIPQDIAELVIAFYTRTDRAKMSKAVAHYHYLQLCQEAGIEPVSRATVYNLLSSPRVVQLKAAAVSGKLKQINVFAPYITQTRVASYPGECFISDHKQLDNGVITPDGKDIVFPYFTLWMDYYSTMLLGWRLVFTPNSDSIVTALIDSVADAGRPDRIKVDNGKDYVSEAVEGLCAALDITVHHALPYNAKAKLIERVFRLFSERFAAALPAYRGYSKDSRPIDCEDKIAFTKQRIAEGGPLGEAHGTCCTWDEYLAHIERFLVWFNAQHLSGFESIEGRTPIAVWSEHPRQPQRVSREALSYLLMKSTTVTVRRCRVRLLGIEFTNVPDLADRHGRKITLRYDPDCLDAVYLFEDSGAFIGIAERVVAVSPFDPVQTEAGLKRNRNELKTYRKRIEIGEDARAAVRALTFEQNAGIPPLRTPPQAPLATRPSVPSITKVDRAARELEAAAEKRAVVNAAAPPPRDWRDDPVTRMLLESEERSAREAQKRFGRAPATRPADVFNRHPRGDNE